MNTITALILAGTLLLSSSVKSEASPCAGLTQPLHVIAGFEALTVSTTAVNLTVPSRSEMAIIAIEVADIRYRDDNTAPTATVGVLIRDGGTILVCGDSLTRIQLIRDASVDATAHVSYYGG